MEKLRDQNFDIFLNKDMITKQI